MSMARGGNTLSMRVNDCPLLFESKVAHFRRNSDRGPQCPDPVARAGGDDLSVRPFDYLATCDCSGELGFGTIAGAWPEPVFSDCRQHSRCGVFLTVPSSKPILKLCS
jgi:hypothetical protein